MIRPEERLSKLARFRFYCIDIVTAGIESVSGVPLRVLVGEEIACRELHGERRVVLARNEFHIGTLVAQFIRDTSSNAGRDGLDHIERGVVGSSTGIRWSPSEGIEVSDKSSSWIHGRERLMIEKISDNYDAVDERATR